MKGTSQVPDTGQSGVAETQTRQVPKSWVGGRIKPVSLQLLKNCCAELIVIPCMVLPLHHHLTRGFSFVKSSCNEMTQYIQHQLFSHTVTDSSTCAMSASVKVSSNPIASVFVTQCSVSCFTCDLEQDLHLPTTFPPHLSDNSSHTDTHS